MERDWDGRGARIPKSLDGSAWPLEWVRRRRRCDAATAWRNVLGTEAVTRGTWPREEAMLCNTWLRERKFSGDETGIDESYDALCIRLGAALRYLFSGRE
eukprot:1721038-Pleurochrysis_carterae.AAC.6